MIKKFRNRLVSKDFLQREDDYELEDVSIRIGNKNFIVSVIDTNEDITEKGIAISSSKGYRQFPQKGDIGFVMISPRSTNGDLKRLYEYIIGLLYGISEELED